MAESKIADLLKEVREVTVHYEKLIGTPATRTRQMIDRYGAVDALSRMAINTEIQSGFKKLRDSNQLHLTFEAVILRHSELFSESIVKAAEFKLKNSREMES